MKKLGTLLILLLTILTTQAQKDGLAVGDTAPSINAVDQFNQMISSQTILDSSDNYLLIFYRGSWCKYCRKHLSELSDSLSLILDKNTSVIVVTPETPESRERMISSTGATFSIISDTTYAIMDAFDVSYKISKETVPKYRSNVIRMSTKSNGNEAGILPIPATYIVGNDGVIKWKHVDMDYTNRSTIKEILHQLEK